MKQLAIAAVSLAIACGVDGNFRDGDPGLASNATGGVGAVPSPTGAPRLGGASSMGGSGGGGGSFSGTPSVGGGGLPGTVGTGGNDSAQPVGGAPLGGSANLGGAGSMNALGGQTGLGGIFGDNLASPEPPEGLTRYLTGNDTDADVAPSGPGLILMGGGSDVTAAFQWWKGLIASGDIVVLRTSGADGYNNYLYEMGGSDSVETLMVTSRELANSDYVDYRVSRAEGVFLAGGDQSTYMEFWKGTKVQDALKVVHARGGVIGGTSAGLAVLGEFVYAGYQGSATSATALMNPFHRDVTLDRDFLDFTALRKVLTDSHFAQRDRFGRLVTFMARLVVEGWGQPVYGVGVSEATALAIGPDGVGTALGANSAYVVEGALSPERCQDGQSVVYQNLRYARLSNGETIRFPLSPATELPLQVSVNDGEMSPASPY